MISAKIGKKIKTLSRRLFINKNRFTVQEHKWDYIAKTKLEKQRIILETKYFFYTLKMLQSGRSLSLSLSLSLSFFHQM